MSSVQVWVATAPPVICPGTAEVVRLDASDDANHRPALPARPALERAGRPVTAALAECRHSQHDAGMATSVTIRDVPDRARDELAARAAASGRSLQEYLRAKLIELASRPDREAVLARIRERKERTGTRLGARAILGHRDAERR